MVTVSLIASLVGVGVLVLSGVILIYRYFKYGEKRRRKVSELETPRLQSDDACEEQDTCSSVRRED